MARYRLKTMVLARTLAEASVCILFIIIPVVLHLNGSLSGFPPTVRAMLYCLAGIGAVLVPWFGFIVWQVSTDDNGISTHSMFKKHTLEWSKIQNLSRRSSFAWMRYIVEGESKVDELTFPVLLNKLDDLIAEITEHLPPTAGRLRSSHRIFVYDRFSFVLQFLQSLGAIIFAIVFWFFFVAKMNISHNNTDVALLLTFCAVITLIFAWRMQVVATIPKSVETTRDALLMTTYFGKRVLPWNEITGLGLPMPLLPEGFTIKSKKGSVLIGSAMECADELQGFIRSRIDGVSSGSGMGVEEAVSSLDFEAIKARIDEQVVRSQEVLESLKEQEIDLQQPCEIDHCFYADTHYAITGLGQNLADQGFEVDVFPPIEADGVKIDLWTMKVRVSQSPEDAGAEKNAAYMMGLAEKYACVYDGWMPDLIVGAQGL